MRVLFTGGGTAGHVSPALAISEIITDSYEGCKIAFVGRKNGDENRAVSRAGYKLYTLDIAPLHRSLTLKNIKVLKKLVSSGSQARKIIKEFKPDLIIGTGGYVSYPILRAGIKLNIPTLLHESNAYPGLVTRLLSKKVNAVMLGIEDGIKYLSPRVNAVAVGNPVRRGFCNISRDKARESLGIKRGEIFILSFGGSGGSEKLNDTIIGFMKSRSKAEGIRHIHASGRKYYDDIKKSYPELTSGKSKIVPYIENMPEMLCAADIAITRSGAMTIAELSKAATPAILIPSPNVAANHQYKNAKALDDAGAALLLTEDKLTPDTLNESVFSLINDLSLQRKMKEKLKHLSGKECEQNILKVIKNTLNS